MTNSIEQIKFDLSGVTIDDLVEFEEGDTASVKFIRDFLGRFISNGKKGVLTPDAGVKKIGQIRIQDIPKLREKFTAELNSLSDVAVNPTNESGFETD